jgi:hypothetical protein
MNLNLHIERLVLDGLSVANHEAALVQTAVEAELGRLLANESFAPVQSSAHAGVGGAKIHLPPGITARELGLEIGRSLFASLAQVPFKPREQTRRETALTARAGLQLTRMAPLPLHFADADQEPISPRTFASPNPKVLSQQPLNANQQERKIVCLHPE